MSVSVPLASLWLPILLSAVLAHLAGFLLYMVFRFHAGDWKGVPDQPGLREALRRQQLVPGQYLLPFCQDPKDLQRPEVQKQFVEGPIAMLTVVPNGLPAMGRSLTQMFVYYLVVSFFLAYVAAHTLAPGTPYLEVFRVVGTAGFLAYGAATIPASIWYGRPWSVAMKDLVDALVWGLMAAGSFGAFWPKG